MSLEEIDSNLLSLGMRSMDSWIAEKELMGVELHQKR